MTNDISSKVIEDFKVTPDAGSNPRATMIVRKRPNYGSVSEMEDEAAIVKLVNDCGQVSRAFTQSVVKIYEIRPQMTLQLVKVEEGLCSGAIIFHEFAKKTPEEVKMLRENIEQREELWKQRRAKQEANVHQKE